MTKKRIKEILHNNGVKISKNGLEFIMQDFEYAIHRFADNASKANIKVIRASNSEYWKYSFYELMGLTKKG